MPGPEFRLTSAGKGKLQMTMVSGGETLTAQLSDPPTRSQLDEVYKKIRKKFPGEENLVVHASSQFRRYSGG